MYATTYHRPKTLAEAEALLAGNPDAKLLAGGHTLLPTMKQRLAAPTDLVDIARLPELRGIRREGNALVIGAATRHHDVEASAEVKSAIPALAELAHLVGDPAVRHRGTLGGSIANNDPAADYPAAVLGLNATVQTSRRSVGADGFFRGMFETALDEGEIITAVSFPLPRRAGYAKFRNPASRYAMVGVFVAELADGSFRVAVTGAGPCVFRVPEMERALAGSFTPAAVKAVKVPADGLNADMHGSAEYRAHLVSVMAGRAVEAAK